MTAVQDDNYLEYAESVAIRMFPVDTTLGIAEGIETALSCKQFYGVNTWSVINTNFMKKIQSTEGCYSSCYLYRYGLECGRSCSCYGVRA